MRLILFSRPAPPPPPPGFQWLAHGRLAGIARLRLLASVDDDLASWRALGCDLLISVEERAPIQEADAERHGLTYLHVPAEHGHAPTVAAAWYACDPSASAQQWDGSLVSGV